MSKKLRKRPTSQPDPELGSVVPRQREWLDPDLTWHALWCRPNRERRAAAALGRAGISVYRPLEARRVVRRGTAVTVERSPVGRYLFAGLEPDRHFRAIGRALRPFEAPPLSFTLVDENGAYSLAVRPVRPEAPDAVLMFTAAGPVTVPAEVLQAFSDLVTMHGVEMQGHGLLVGQRVRVLEGPLAGFLALLDAVEDSRVRGLVDLFGRFTPVEFEPRQLEAA